MGGRRIGERDCLAGIRLSHADDRVARKSRNDRKSAQVARERDVSIGLRRTLLTQAERLQHLAGDGWRKWLVRLQRKSWKRKPAAKALRNRAGK